MDSVICRCTSCVYYRPASGSSTYTNMCYFCYDNGYPRRILPVDCYKKEGTAYINKKDKDAKEKMEKHKKGELDMANGKIVSIETKRAAVDDVNKGDLTVQQVADKFGVGKSSLTRWLKKEREKTGAFAPDVIDRKTKQEAVDTVLAGGKKYREVAEKYGVSEQTVYNWVKAAKGNRKEEKPEDAKAEKSCDLKTPAEDAVVTNSEVKPAENETHGSLKVKAAAFDEIANIVTSYPEANGRELVFYISGIVSLVDRLGGEYNG